MRLEDSLKKEVFACDMVLDFKAYGGLKEIFEITAKTRVYALIKANTQ